ncbi:pseudaminic acid cytidylyltransferase [Zwartia vadi]|uniref:pseudaminic acid cytidylyltransferase n=1 Tax=Zwartia vadi TaxID=3058168 RepID=UPI0025B47A5C|nr:pseudaminic acid cytidylyltransferase [Zwartia vadi]MDN3988247.1 pseudaminic acid cytidylyltransferase [Zwartia vadi]
MKIAVIPARGGSKRIPRKNIKFFCNKPMIAWSIKAAHASGLFDHVVVSTDDAEIAEVAKLYGAEVPFMRPASLSDDHTGTSPTIAHAIQWYREQGYQPDPVCCIYATAPFVMASDLQTGLQRLTQTGSDFVFSATSYAFPIQRAIRLNSKDRVEMFQPESFSTRSQDLPEALHDAGQFYWGRASAWLSGQVIFGPQSSVVRVPRHRVQDIDTFEDWTHAEYLFRIMTQERDR